MEFSLELCQLTDILQSTLIEFDLLVRHDAACCISLSRIIQAFRHTTEHLKHFLIFIVELITCCDICLEQETDSLVQIMNVAESNVDL